MPLITVPISEAANDKLRRLAALEFRRPKDQAAVLLIEALARRQVPHEAPAADRAPTASKP